MSDEFEVVYPGTVKDDFRELCRKAKRCGLLDLVAESIAKIDAALRADPRSFGDPSFPLPASQQDVFVRGLSPLYVSFAVHRIEKIVIVREIRWFSHHNLT